MFNSIKPDQNSQTSLIQQCLANYNYSNAAALAEDLLLLSDSEENKGLLADCYLSQQENIKAYFLLKHSTSSLNLYKLAVACLRLNTLTEAENALLRGNQIPNGVHGIELLGTIYKKQGKFQEAKETYRKALQKNPILLSTKKKLDKLSIGFNRFEVKNEVIQEVKQGVSVVEKSNLFGKPWDPAQTTTTSTGLFERRFAADDENPSEEFLKDRKVTQELLNAKSKNVEIKESDFNILAENFRKKVLKGEEKERNDLFGTGGGGLPVFGSNFTTNHQWKSTAMQSDEPPSEEKSYEIVDLAIEEREKEVSPILIIEKEPTKKKINKKSIEAVDMYFDEEDCGVYTGDDGKFYSKRLNQTNIMANNNKFYVMQILESIKKRGTYYFWTRWGRVGAQGQSKKIKAASLEEAIKMFEEKIQEKVVKGHYCEIEMKYAEEDPEETIVDLSREEREREKKEVSPILVIDKEPTKKNNKKSKELRFMKGLSFAEGVKAVDMYFDEEDCEVYTGDDGKFYSKFLNQSNLAMNNNKFYVAQLLESITERGTYYFWTRWGRVGAQGQSAKVKAANLEEAIKMFDQKVYDKTVKGPYLEIEIEYEEDGPEETIVENEKKSELPEKVQDVIKLIFDEKMMTGLVKQTGYDVQKSPLGKLAGNTIRKGYEILKEISNAIERQRPRDIFTQYSADFYTVIPHDFGFQKMSIFVIDTHMKVKEKLELLATLENIRIAMPIFSQPNNDLHLLDAYYQKLNCKLTRFHEDSDDFAMITEYMKNTYAATHSAFTLEVLDIFNVERQGEAENYLNYLGNKQLLWFGARLNNYAGILSEGLKLPPAEAPDNDFMFGKGIYFTDMVSKAANYCFAHQGDNVGILLLCEVALGECNEKFEADFNAANLPRSKQSVKGVGRSEPAASGSKIIDNEVMVPMGKPENNNNGKGCLLYNEYVVYDIRQIKIRYLVKVKFNSKFGY